MKEKEKKSPARFLRDGGPVWTAVHLGDEGPH